MFEPNFQIVQVSLAPCCSEPGQNFSGESVVRKERECEHWMRAEGLNDIYLTF
jgi:hypothetical protein